MADFINTVDQFGDDATTVAIIERTITEFNDDVLSSVGKFGFAYCGALTSVNLPNATRIGGYGFYKCSNLRSVNLPNVTSVGDGSFGDCSISVLTLPKVTSITADTLLSCEAYRIILPSLTNLPEDAFRAHRNLGIVDFSKTLTISRYAFSVCDSLYTLILRSDEVCPLSDCNAFDNTPFDTDGVVSSVGTVYVPRVLIEEYQNATNWSTLYAAGTCKFVAIEGSRYE
jgi:hypothetical protein